MTQRLAPSEPAGEASAFPAGDACLDQTVAFRTSLDQLRMIEQFCVSKSISSGKTVSRSDGLRELVDVSLRWFPRGRT